MAEFKCPECNARFKIPESGLTMTCEFCAHEMPVPDAASRRAKMEKEEARRKKEERRLEKEAEKKRAREAARAQQEKKEQKKRWANRGRFIASLPGKIIGLLLPFVGLAIPAFILYNNGMFDRWIGKPGTAYHQAVAQQLVGAGYTPMSYPAVVGVGGFGDPTSPQHVQMQKGYCYAFAVGSGEIISEVALTNPKGKKAAKDNTRGYARFLTHCPGQSGLFALDVQLLGGNGRFTYTNYFKPAPSPTRPARPGNPHRPARPGNKGRKGR